jgi:hypothetical protein
MAQIKNLRDFLAEVQRRGWLYEFTEPIHNESELTPLYRVQTCGLPEAGFSKISAERTDANHPLISPKGQKRREYFPPRRLSTLAALSVAQRVPEVCSRVRH